MQNDRLAWNCIPKFGMYYMISVPFLIIGLICSFKKSKLKNEYDSIMNIWFISSFLLLFVFIYANINRINILIFPLIFYIVKGLEFIVHLDKKIINNLLIILYIVLFIMFCTDYIKLNVRGYIRFTDNIQEVIEYVESQDVEKIYFEYAIKEPYIYVLYYGQYNPHEYVDTVQYFKPKGAFENIKAFGSYYFYVPEELNEANCLYVIKKNNELEIDYDKFDVKEFEKYLVLRLN